VPQVGSIERTLPGPWRGFDRPLIDPNPNLNTVHKTLHNFGYAAYRCWLGDSGLDSVMLGLGLRTVLTTMWAIFGGKRRTTILCENAELAYLCAFCGQGGIRNSALLRDEVSGSSPLVGYVFA